MQIAFVKCHGSGNDFPLIDARGMTLADTEWAAVARALADRDGPVGGDGILLLTQGEGAHAFGMRMLNSDGSEAETCLNGLRCVARAGFEALGIDAARVKLKTSSAEVAREPDLAPGVVSVRTIAGPAAIGAAAIGLDAEMGDGIERRVPGLPGDGRYTAVAMPNPHLIRFVETVDEDALVALGRWTEAGPALIPGRANVSFVEQRGADLFVRTFERGVGLTNACGSAMAGSVLAAALTGRIGWGADTRVLNKGGLVHGRAGADRVVTISGNATFLYDATVEVDLANARAGVPVIHARREDEARAWEAVVAGVG